VSGGTGCGGEVVSRGDVGSSSSAAHCTTGDSDERWTMSTRRPGSKTAGHSRGTESRSNRDGGESESSNR
jgi:hypothetical protein